MHYLTALIIIYSGRWSDYSGREVMYLDLRSEAVFLYWYVRILTHSIFDYPSMDILDNAHLTAH